MANTVTYTKYDYVQKLRTRLAKPTCWKDIFKVIISDNYSIINSYMSTEPDVDPGTRGTAYTYNDFVLTADTLTIGTYKNLPMLIDEADRYQQTYVDAMSIAAYQGDKVNEYLEGQCLAQYGQTYVTDFGATDLTNSGDDDTTAITVSATNIDNLIRQIKRKIFANNGVDIAAQRGIYIVWRANDYALLEEFVQANGFQLADLALKNGIPPEKAFKYMGVYHYLSNSHTTGHLLAGVRGSHEIGILRGTYGKAKFIEDPGQVSGLGIVTRVDYGFGDPPQLAEFTMDVNVA